MTECWGSSISRVDVTALKQFKLWYSASTSHQRCQNRSPLLQNGWANTSSPLATRIYTSPSKTYPSSRRRRIVWLTSATSIKCNSNSVFFLFLLTYSTTRELLLYKSSTYHLKNTIRPRSIILPTFKINTLTNFFWTIVKTWPAMLKKIYEILRWLDDFYAWMSFFIIQEWRKNRKPDLFNLDVKNLVLTGTDAAEICLMNLLF